MQNDLGQDDGEGSEVQTILCSNRVDVIQNNWEKYFMTRHEGLGTTYERFVLHGYFRRIKARYNVKKVLESPVFGMTGISGINSLWWAVQGAQVTLVDHHRERLNAAKRVWHEMALNARFVYDSGAYAHLPFEDGEFDMAWNFAALNVKPHALLEELARVAGKVIFICLPNRFNPFSVIRKGFLKKSKSFENPGMRSESIENGLAALGWQIREKGYFDVPPWPDIAMSKADFCGKMGLSRYAKRLERKITPENRLCVLDYYNGRKKWMKEMILKYAFLENSPELLKRVWAHHRYYLFEPRVT
ncbi:MAG: class I SAM-dependent methyltransferase [Desulfatiglandaceae bacterium]